MSMRDMLESQNPELEAAGSRQSWHDLYKSSSWIYVGGLDYGLTEGDIEAVFSQYGKIVQLNYVKDRWEFCVSVFCKYAWQFKF